MATPVETLTPTPTLDIAHRLLATMDTDQKIGQLMMTDLDRHGSVDDLADVVGAGLVTGVLLLGNDWDADDVRQVVSALRQQSVAQPVGLYIAVDQEGGNVQRLSGDGFDAIASATEQGTWATDDLQEAATKWARQLSSVGVNLNLAPVTDTVPDAMKSSNKPIGVFRRQFGSDPGSVGDHAAAFVRGMNAGGVQTCVKHFPGLGRIKGNTDVSGEGTNDSVTTRDDPYLTAFAKGIAANPAMVMVSLATYDNIDPDHVAAFSPIIITQMLRGDLGWSGVVISDALNAGAVKSVPVDQRGVDFIEAGGDIAIFPGLDDLTAAADGIKQQMQSSPQFAAMVDQSVLRVLEAKLTAGLIG